MKETDNPRNFEHADAFGDYVVITKISQTHVDPCEKLNIQIFFSGYGKIENPKISFYPSSNFFDATASDMRFGIGKDKDGKIIFGTQIEKIHPDGHAIILHGVKQPKWGASTLFFDDHESTNRVVTEKRLRNAPMELNFLVDKKARSGSYSIRFVFTYFNGERWCTSFQDTEFFIRNVIQRYEKWAWFLGAFAAVVTIMAFLAEICVDSILLFLK